MSRKVRKCVHTVRVKTVLLLPKLDYILGLKRSKTYRVLTFRLWGASSAHDVEEAAVDLSQITYEREETEKSRDN